MLAKKIIEKEQKEDFGEKRKNMEKLAKYITLKKSQFNLSELMSKENKKKLIII